MPKYDQKTIAAVLDKLKSLRERMIEKSNVQFKNKEITALTNVWNVELIKVFSEELEEKIKTMREEK